MADRQRLTQAVMNLTQNAVEHTGERRRDRAGLAARGEGDVRLWVRDTGPGVPEAERQRIFERFVRANGARAAPRAPASAWRSSGPIAEAHGGASSSTADPARAPASPS